MSEVRAGLGDSVEFIFPSGDKIFGHVLHMPQATGDSWIIQTYESGEKGLIAYVQNFECMYLMKSKP